MDGTGLERADTVLADIRRLMAVAGRLIAESKLLIAQSQRLTDAHQRVTTLIAWVPEVVSDPTLPNG